MFATLDLIEPSSSSASQISSFICLLNRINILQNGLFFFLHLGRGKNEIVVLSYLGPKKLSGKNDITAVFSFRIVLDRSEDCKPLRAVSHWNNRDKINNRLKFRHVLATINF